MSSKVTRYYPAWCPRCGHEGEMFIARKSDGALCFSCDECSWTCDRFEDLADFSKGYEGFNLELAAPSFEQIVEAGWEKHCIHSE